MLTDVSDNSVAQETSVHQVTLHGATSQKMVTFIATTARMSNRKHEKLVSTSTCWTEGTDRLDPSSMQFNLSTELWKMKQVLCLLLLKWPTCVCSPDTNRWYRRIISQKWWMLMNHVGGSLLSSTGCGLGLRHLGVHRLHMKHITKRTRAMQIQANWFLLGSQGTTHTNNSARFSVPFVLFDSVPVANNTCGNC